jgi:single-strand DNA-binding protein
MGIMKNKVQLIGNLGQDPEIKIIGDDKKVAHISLATNENYRNLKGEKATDTQWHAIVAWGRLAELAEKYLLKGSEILVEGKLINRSYTDKQGLKKYITEVQATEILILSKKP